MVLADLPCSGLGIIGKKPDIKLRLKKEDLGELASLQREILLAASRYVKPGGTLLYSTCTVDRAENEENANWILEKLPFHKNGDRRKAAGIPAGRLLGKPDPAPSGDPWLRRFFSGGI